MFVKVSGEFSVDEAVATSVPSPLSVTVTVTVFPDSAALSFVTPATVPDSVTV